MTEKNIFHKFISNLDRFSLPINLSTMLQFINVTDLLLVRIYKKNHELIDEKEITHDGEYLVFDKLPGKGDYLIQILDKFSISETLVRYR